VSRTSARDAASGFRAFSREACQRLYVHSTFSYCMETLVQAGNVGLRVGSVDVRVNPATRPSRLAGSTLRYLYRSGMTILAMFVLYRPGRFFATLGSALLALAAILGFRFLYLVYVVQTPGRTYLPSLIFLSISALAGFLLVVFGIVGELLRAERRIAEETLYLARIRDAESERS
jgi:hypothetical protein